MPFPKELQEAMDKSPAPSADNVFSIADNVMVDADESSDPINTSEEGWLTKLLDGEGDAPAPAPDASLTPDDSFLPDEGTDDFSFPDIEPDGTGELGDVKKMLAALESKMTKSDDDASEQEAFDSAVSKLSDKYGVPDQELLDNFSDLFSTFRAKVGSEMGTEMIKMQSQYDKRIAQLEARFEGLKPADADESIKTPTDSPNQYRDVMAEAIPDYQKVISSKQFKQLMSKPVDADNPDFTFNKKLGKLYSQRRTADIMTFFSAFAGKYLQSGTGNAVVDGGTSSVSKGGQGVKATLNPDRLRSILNRVMIGELTMSESEIEQLRAVVAKQSMSD